MKFCLLLFRSCRNAVRSRHTTLFDGNMFHIIFVAILLQLNILESHSIRFGFETVTIARTDNGGGSLSQLKRFELLKVKEVRRTVRSTADSDLKQVHFSAFNRNFDLLLTRSKHLLSPHFKAFIVDAVGDKQRFAIDYDEFYEGSLLGQSNTKVSTHIDSSNGLMTAAIHDANVNEVYFIEPFWRHANASYDKNTHSDSMLIYRSSDVERSANFSQNASFCQSMKLSNDSTVNENDTNANKERGRRKRNDGSDWEWDDVQLPNSRCALLLVADYLFYETVGAKNMRNTINYLIALISRINIIFTQTTFSDSENDENSFKDYGFTIQEIRVHKEPSTSEYFLYNTFNASWSPMDLLAMFSREKDHESFCLAHLFTRRNFHPTLGMAYVASPKKDAIGGICSQPEYKKDSVSYPNTGFTTSINKFESQLTTSELDLVTAHELGHSWGAQHDPDTTECSPNYRDGGSYIMYFYTITGRDKNNKYFSVCSRRAIKAVLNSKAESCFIKPLASFCGNGVIEEGEECDAGLIITGSEDNCCTYDCKLKPGADCSDQNHPCCNRCRFVSAGVRCRDEHQLDCLAESFCNGYSAQCPASAFLDDGVECLDRGECVSGKCQPFCETKNLHSCVCENAIDGCKRCCLMPNDTCIPYNNTEILSDGTPCVRGYCERGVCKHVGRDLAHRFWHIIQSKDVNAFALFMKDNIVGTVIVLSLLLWIPICCVIKLFDRRVKRRIRNTEAIQQKIRLIRRPSITYDEHSPHNQNGVRFHFEVQVINASDSD